MSLEKLVAGINKSFGQGTAVLLGDSDIAVAAEVISTGSPAIDRALVIGGLPRGRVVEVYGPPSGGKTTITLQTVAQAQKMGLNAAFVDVENALDAQYAANLGVDTKNLIVSQPDYGEQALEITESLIRTGELGIVVVDSVAALVPKAELEGEMGQAQMGLQARMMSQAMRKLNKAVASTNVVLIFINQIRYKLGVMFGCFEYSARVVLRDGSTKKIGTIVNQRLPVDVLAFDPLKKTFSSKKVINWFKNGKADHFLRFTTESVGGSGTRSFACTENHLLLSPLGYKKAKDFETGDEVVTGAEHYLTHELEQIVIGSALGDGSIRKNYKNTATLRIGHGPKQDDYCRWKYSLFAGAVGKLSRNSKKGLSFETKSSNELSVLKDITYDRSKKSAPLALIEKLSPISVAIWYMDDGTFDSGRKNRCSISCQGLSSESRNNLSNWFNSQGIGSTINSGGNICFGKEATKKFHSLISKYVHPSMSYKLLESEKGKFNFRPSPVLFRFQPVPLKILKIGVKPKTRSMYKYDIEVEDKHNYMVDRIVVHNSPETTTAGEALKFYSSIRMDIRRTQAIKSGEEVIGASTRVKIVKNKLAAPFKIADVSMIYGEGVSRELDIIKLGVEAGILEKSGAWYSHNGENLACGQENLRKLLKESPSLTDSLAEEIMTASPQTERAAQPEAEGEEL